MNHPQTTMSRGLLSAAVAAVLGIALPALATASPSYAPSNSMKTPTAGSMNTGANVTSDTDITKNVKSRLSSMSNLQDASINVSTMEGKVTLTGTVASKDEENAAKSAAQAIPGVKKVDDDLSVSTKPPKAGH
ncbi:MAG TPA: BON domain-containing protein [Gammaproteobacteria bacterium]|jgi:hyperosmotically inducible protein